MKIQRQSETFAYRTATYTKNPVKRINDPVKEANVAIREAMQVVADWNSFFDRQIGEGGRFHKPWQHFVDWTTRMQPKVDAAERVWESGQDHAWDNGVGDSHNGNLPSLEYIRDPDLDNLPKGNVPKYDPRQAEDPEDSADWHSNSKAIQDERSNKHFQLHKFQKDPGVPYPMGLALDLMRPSVALQSLPGIPALEEAHYQKKNHGDPTQLEGDALNDAIFLGLSDLEGLV